MTIHNVFTLAIRVLAFWALIRSADGMGYALAWTYSLIQEIRSGATVPTDVDLGHLAASVWAQPAALSIAAIVLWLFAPEIARLSVRWKRIEKPLAPQGAIGQEGVYQIVVQILGLYAIVEALPMGAPSIAWLLLHGRCELSGQEATAAISGAISVAIGLATGVLLLVAAGPIASWLDRLNTDRRLTNSQQPLGPSPADHRR